MGRLFVVDETSELDSSSVSVMRTYQEDVSTRIVAADFQSRRRLRQAGIRYGTPIDYFDLDKAGTVDRLAADAARHWYDPWADRLAYRGISVGRMAEYDFFSIFCDAFRCIDIAGGIIRREKPEMIVLPGRNVLREPIGLCHEFLPEALEHYARLNGIQTCRMAPSAAPGNGGPERGGSVRRALLGRLNGCAAMVRSVVERVRIGLSRDHNYLLLFMTSAGLRDQIGAWTDRKSSVCVQMPSFAGWPGGNARLGAALRGVWQELEPGTAGRVAWDGVPVMPLVARYVQGFFLERGPGLGEAIDSAYRVARVLRPDMLVMMEDITPRSRALAGVFRQVGLPVLVIQHGALLGEMGGLHVMPAEAQRQAVWGDLCRQWHVDRGMRQELEVVTGNPRFDSIRSRGEGWRERVCSELGIDAKRGVVVVATEWYSAVTAGYSNEMEEDYIRFSLRGLAGLSERQVVVKLHPAHQIKYEGMVRAIAEEEQAQIVVARDYLWDLIAMSDAVVIQNSTVGLEAMILGKPVIAVNPRGRSPRSVYVSEGAALEVRSPEELAAGLDQVLGDTEFRGHLMAAAERFVQAYAYLQDGRGSERVAALIAQMLRESRKQKTVESVPDAPRR